MATSKRLKSLLQQWQQSASELRYEKTFRVKLPMHVAAQVMALAELYPGRNEEQIITDVLSAALDEIQESIPYVPGSRVIRQDEFGDDIYEDIGLSARFQDTTSRYLREMRNQRQIK